MRRLTAADAVELFEPTDTLGLPLGPAQPAALLEAMGTRKDWEDLQIFGALVTVLSEVFTHPNVHYLSGFFGPLERLLRDSGANIGFVPADFRRFAPVLADIAPRVMATAAAPPDADGLLLAVAPRRRQRRPSSTPPAPTPTGCSSSR